MIHLTSRDGRKIGDIQPFFYQGRYHIFYMCNASGNEQIDLEHAVSDDLIHWTHLPPAITRSDSGHQHPDGGCIFTGSMVEAEGLVHAFYTSWDPENENGREFIRHAVSRDGIHFEKQENEILAPDGLHYSSARFRDFRDPNVMPCPDGGWELFFLANPPDAHNCDGADTGHFIYGHMRSPDLVHWEQLPALIAAKGDECPDYFLLEGKHYIHSCRTYQHADSRYGPYREGPFTEIDLPHVRAAKTLWDGERLLWFGGWFGGPMSLPRELYAGTDGALCIRPAREVERFFSETVSSGHRYCQVTLPERGPCLFTCALNAPGALTLGGNIRYRFLPDGETLEFGAEGVLLLKHVRFNPQKYCCKVFVEDSCVELFLDDRFACSIPNRAMGESIIEIEGGAPTLWSLRVPADTL